MKYTYTRRTSHNSILPFMQYFSSCISELSEFLMEISFACLLLLLWMSLEMTSSNTQQKQAKILILCHISLSIHTHKIHNSQNTVFPHFHLNPLQKSLIEFIYFIYNFSFFFGCGVWDLKWKYDKVHGQKESEQSNPHVT